MSNKQCYIINVLAMLCHYIWIDSTVYLKVIIVLMYAGWKKIEATIRKNLMQNGKYGSSGLLQLPSESNEASLLISDKWGQEGHEQHVAVHIRHARSYCIVLGNIDLFVAALSQTQTRSQS